MSDLQIEAPKKRKHPTPKSRLKTERLKETKAKIYKVMYPDGKIHIVINLTEFARNRQLDRPNLNRTLKHPGRTVKGYRLMEIYE